MPILHSLHMPMHSCGNAVLSVSAGTLTIVGPKNAGSAISVFQPSTAFSSRWAPLFYTPVLAALPTTLYGMPGMWLLCAAHISWAL